MVYEKITDRELKLIKHYIGCYGAYDDDGYSYRFNTNDLDIETVLSYWRRNKEKLFKLFGNELILRKPIHYKKDLNQLSNDIRDNTTIYHFTRRFRDDFYDLYRYSRTYDIICYYILAHNILATNKVDMDYTFVHPTTEEEIKIQKGMKATKAIKKLLSWTSLTEEEYEDFRLEHSRILNDKGLDGTLCLSIHPMDYITMSDNVNNWSSCMSWMGGGGYRGGTVECLNSKNTIVAYLESENSLEFIVEDELTKWNSKKWRCLFVVEDNVICSVKSYPCHNDDILDIVIKWIAELANANWSTDYNADQKPFTMTDGSIILKTELGDAVNNRRKPYMWFETHGVMYNDFGCAINHHYLLSESFKEIEKTATEDMSIRYTEQLTCMCCGREFRPDYEGLVLCEDCYSPRRCDECGCIVGDCYELGPDGQILCDCCYDNICSYDELRAETIYEDESVEIQVKEIPEYSFITSEIALNAGVFFKEPPKRSDEGWESLYITNIDNLTDNFLNAMPYGFRRKYDDLRAIRNIAGII